MSTLQNGRVGTSCVNAQETYQYNKRLQPWVISLAAAGSTGYCRVYNYFTGTWTPPSSCPRVGSAPPTGTTDNGDVMGYWYQDGALSTASHKLSYSYDSLNRLGTAVATDLSDNTLWSQTYTYDRWGNMSCSGTGLCTSMSYNASNNNQLSSVGLASVTYDAAGNLTQDSSSVPPHSYQWDAEGHIRSIDSGTTANMTFNALGWRVYRSNAARSYWVDPQGRLLGGYWGQWNAAVPLGGRTLAEYASGSNETLYFDHPNALGSEEQWTNWAGSYAGEVQFYPWGAKWGDTTNGNLYHYFASLQLYDPEVDGYQPPNRYEIPRLGRWLTPDPLAGDITNPQSLNLYAYVMNNPTTFSDPLGLGGDDNCTWDPSTNPLTCPKPPPEETSQSNQPNVDWTTGASPDGGAGGGPGGSAINVLQRAKNTLCSALPQGRVTSLNGGIGEIGGQNGSLSLVINYNSGQVSGFATGGVQAGWNGIAQASVSTGFIYGELGSNNSGYSGRFTGGSLSGATFGVFGSFGKGVQVYGASLGASMTGGLTFGLSRTATSNPVPLGSALTNPLSTPLDQALTLARKAACQ